MASKSESTIRKTKESFEQWCKRKIQNEHFRDGLISVQKIFESNGLKNYRIIISKVPRNIFEDKLPLILDSSAEGLPVLELAKAHVSNNKIRMSLFHYTQFNFIASDSFIWESGSE